MVIWAASAVNGAARFQEPGAPSSCKMLDVHDSALRGSSATVLSSTERMTPESHTPRAMARCCLACATGGNLGRRQPDRLSRAGAVASHSDGPRHRDGRAAGPSRGLSQRGAAADCGVPRISFIGLRLLLVSTSGQTRHARLSSSAAHVCSVSRHTPVIVCSLVR